MAVTQSVERALASAIGEGGIRDNAFGRRMEAAAQALEALRIGYRDRTMPALRQPEATDDLPAIEEAAARLRDGATDIVVIGTGGACLVAQALVQLKGYGVPALAALAPTPRLHFLDNLDALTLSAVLQQLDLETTRFIAVSRSGATAETLAQAMAVIGALDAAGQGSALPERMLAITGARTGNGLRDLLEPLAVPVLDHGEAEGRFAAFSIPALLPAALAGLDIAKLRAGALEVVATMLNAAAASEVAAVVGAALHAAALDSGKTGTVLFGYGDRLERMGLWWRQLVSESLGKGGAGLTPLVALGPLDQHTQLQLFLDGPGDKLFTLVVPETRGTGARLDVTLAGRAGESGFGGRTIGDITAAQAAATVEALARHGRPVRVIHTPPLDEASLGALLMQLLMEVILTASLLNLDPFTQPAVEEGKALARSTLAGDNRSG